VGSDAVRVIEIYRVMLRLGFVIAVIACLNRGGFTVCGSASRATSHGA
jgi:hypothetical protein